MLLRVVRLLVVLVIVCEAMPPFRGWYVQDKGSKKVMRTKHKKPRDRIKKHQVERRGKDWPDKRFFQWR